MKKLKLTISNSEPLLVAGLVSSAGDIKLAWTINNLLNINLARIENKDIESKLGITEYSVFQYTDQIINVSLINNSTNLGYFFEDQKKFNYFLLVSGEAELSFVDQVKQKLRNEPLISACIDVPFSAIKKKELFQFF